MNLRAILCHMLGHDFVLYETSMSLSPYGTDEVLRWFKCRRCEQKSVRSYPGEPPLWEQRVGIEEAKE